MPWGAAAICLVVCIDQNSIILCHHPINWCNLRENKLMIVRYTQNTQFYVCQYPFLHSQYTWTHKDRGFKFRWFHYFKSQTNICNYLMRYICKGSIKYDSMSKTWCRPLIGVLLYVGCLTTSDILLSKTPLS